MFDPVDKRIYRRLLLLHELATADDERWIRLRQEDVATLADHATDWSTACSDGCKSTGSSPSVAAGLPSSIETDCSGSRVDLIACTRRRRRCIRGSAISVQATTRRPIARIHGRRGMTAIQDVKVPLPSAPFAVSADEDG